MTEYGNRIKEICRMRDISLGELGNRLGWHQVTVSNFIHGKNGTPKLSSLEKVAKALDVRVGDLFERTGILEPPEEHLAPGQFMCPKCGAILEVREASAPSASKNGRAE